jgi:hypothetical protein
VGYASHTQSATAPLAAVPDLIREAKLFRFRIDDGRISIQVVDIELVLQDRSTSFDDAAQELVLFPCGLKTYSAGLLVFTNMLPLFKQAKHSSNCSFA